MLEVVAMICEECAYEADQVKEHGKTHKWYREINQQWIEFGAEHSPIGHVACKGGTHCDCAHLEVGTRVQH